MPDLLVKICSVNWWVVVVNECETRLISSPPAAEVLMRANLTNTKSSNRASALSWISLSEISPSDGLGPSLVWEIPSHPIPIVRFKCSRPSNTDLIWPEKAAGWYETVQCAMWLIPFYSHLEYKILLDVSIPVVTRGVVRFIPQGGQIRTPPFRIEDESGTFKKCCFFVISSGA